MDKSSQGEINRTLDWELIDDGARVSVKLKDATGRPFSLVFDINDVWELFLSLFGATANALTQKGLVKADSPNIRATHAEVSAGETGDCLNVTFHPLHGSPITLEIDRQAASQLRKALPLENDSA